MSDGTVSCNPIVSEVLMVPMIAKIPTAVDELKDAPQASDCLAVSEDGKALLISADVHDVKKSAKFGGFGVPSHKTSFSPARARPVERRSTQAPFCSTGPWSTKVSCPVDSRKNSRLSVISGKQQQREKREMTNGRALRKEGERSSRRQGAAHSGPIHFGNRLAAVRSREHMKVCGVDRCMNAPIYLLCQEGNSRIGVARHTPRFPTVSLASLEDLVHDVSVFIIFVSSVGGLWFSLGRLCGSPIIGRSLRPTLRLMIEGSRQNSSTRKLSAPTAMPRCILW